MLCDVAPGADPGPVAAGGVVEELDDAGNPVRPPDQPVVPSDISFGRSARSA
jgi:hypothetical protein